jgi:hypothetical protein
MKAGQRAAAFALLALLGWSGPAVAAGETEQKQSRPQIDSRLPLSSWCLAKCNELELACKALENRFPTCSPNDICLDEKQQCEAMCRPRVKLLLPAGGHT